MTTGQRTVPKPGIYPSIPFAEYRAWDAINATFLSTLAKRSPYHAKHDRDFPKPETPAKRVGRALHSYILEPATFDKLWGVCPPCDRRTKIGKELYEQFRVAKGNRDEVKEEEFNEIKAMAVEVRRQQCVETICGGRAELSIVWIDGDTELLCKRRLDYERSEGWNHYITDAKSSDDISPREFGRDMATYGYAMAGAFSIDGWKAITDEDSTYTLLAVEKEYHIAKIWEPDDDTIAAGRDEYRQALDLAAQCIKDDIWPAYGQDPELLRAPEWYLRLHGINPFQIRT
jgi:exodeoxyribonuclease VIII